MNAYISETTEPNLMKLGMIVETYKYYNFMKKNQNRLEAIGGHFEKCHKKGRNLCHSLNVNLSKTTGPIFMKLYTYVL